MWRIVAIVIGLSLATVGPAGNDKKPAEPKKDGYFKVSFEAKGILKLTLDKHTKAITRFYLDGAYLFPPKLALDDNKALHEAAKKVDGKMVIATGHGKLFIWPSTGHSNGGERIEFTITAFRAVEDKK